MIPLIISGANGKMGHELAALTAKADDLTCIAGVDPQPGRTDFPLFASFDDVPRELTRSSARHVVIDFSNASTLSSLLSYCLKNECPAVLGSTGYSEADFDEIAKAAQHIAIFQSSNMSLGVYVLHQLAKVTAALLRDEGFDIEILEKHHRQQTDAPSGTAKMLLEAVCGPDSQIVYDRHSYLQSRDRREIGVHSVRGGTVAGEHQVCFLGNGETLTLQHTAESRTIFALGALKAARFIYDAGPGLFHMNDLMNAKQP